MALDITELFAKDPLQYTEQDLDAIIARFREARRQFNLGNVKAGSTKPKTPKQKVTSELLSKLDMKLDL